MKLTSPQQWKLQIFPEKYELQGHRTFSGTSSSRIPKLYVFSDPQGQPLYVGIAKRSMSNRLRSGFTAKGKGGYHGYAFRRPAAIREYGGLLNFTVWGQADPKPEKSNGRIVLNSDGTKRWSLADMEKVEAELVYLIRLKTGEWPRYQTEIHFSKPEPEHSLAAEEIFEFLVGLG